MGEVEDTARSLNGQTGAVLRWLLGLVAAAGVSYFTAQGAINERVAVVETKENAHFEEVQRSLKRVEASVERISEALERRNSAVQQIPQDDPSRGPIFGEWQSIRRQK